MIDVLQKQCDEVKVKVEQLYKIFDAVIRATDTVFRGSEIRGDRNGISFGVFLNDKIIGSIALDINNMTVTCNKADENGNITATCVRSADTAIPFREEYSTNQSSENKKLARDWFFEVSEAEYVDDTPIPEPETASVNNITDVGTEVEEVEVDA